MPRKAVTPVAPPAQLRLFDEGAQQPLSAKASAAKTTAEKTAEPSRHPWSWLLERVFDFDLLVCVRCGGALRIVKIATRPDDHVLGVLGSLRAPPRALRAVARALGEQGLPRGPPAAEQTENIHGHLALQFR